MHNLRAALLMVLAMAAFACEDALLKGLSGTIPTGQLLAVIGFAGMAVFGLWIAISPEGLRLRNLLRPRSRCATCAKPSAPSPLLPRLQQAICPSPQPSCRRSRC